jgi:hypothetical protein
MVMVVVVVMMMMIMTMKTRMKTKTKIIHILYVNMSYYVSRKEAVQLPSHNAMLTSPTQSHLLFTL